MRPRISIIIAVYNGAATLLDCLDSIEAQDLVERETLVVDGGSTDGTVDLLRNHPAVTFWLSEPDRGIYDAWNKGVQRAKGDWICFLGADDALAAPDVLSRILPHLAEAERQGIRYVHGDLLIVDEAGAPLGVGGGPIDVRRSLALPSHPGSMHHRDLFADHGLFDPTFKIAGDQEFLSRELKDRPSLYVPGLVIAKFSLGGVSDRMATRFRHLHESKLAARRHGLPVHPVRLYLGFVASILQKSTRRVIGRRATGVLTDGIRVMLGKPRLWTRRPGNGPS